MKKNWLPLIIGFVITILVLFAVFIFLIFLPNKQTLDEKIALITVIPAPTSTPIIGLTIFPTPTMEITETIENNYKFKLGEFVQI